MTPPAGSIACATTVVGSSKTRPPTTAARPQNGTADVFDNFFENKDLDPATGGLLGRYVAEERDSGRKFAECYGLLCAEADKAAAKAAKGGGGGGGKGKKSKKK